MRKRQSHEQSRIGKHKQAVLNMMLYEKDPVEREKLQKEYDKLQQEWMMAGWKRRFPNHDMNGNLINKEDKPKNKPE